MRTLAVGVLALLLGTGSAASAGGGLGTSAAWCPGPLGDLFPGRPAWLGAPSPPSAGRLRPLRVRVGGGVEGAVGVLDQLPGGADRPAGSVGTGRSTSAALLVGLLSARGRTVLFAHRKEDGSFRAFRWPAGHSPAAVTVTLTPGGVRLSVPAPALPCSPQP